MAALTRARKNPPKTLTAIERVLANNETAFNGGLACVDTATGELVAGQTGAGLIPIGIFDGIPESGIKGDGTKKVRVRLPREIVGHWFASAAAPNAVADSDFLGFCYILDDQTVTMDDAGASVAGRVWEVSASRGVLVELAIDVGPQGPAGADGADA